MYLPPNRGVESFTLSAIPITFFCKKVMPLMIVMLVIHSKGYSVNFENSDIELIHVLRNWERDKTLDKVIHFHDSSALPSTIFSEFLLDIQNRIENLRMNNVNQVSLVSNAELISLEEKVQRDLFILYEYPSLCDERFEYIVGYRMLCLRLNYLKLKLKILLNPNKEQIASVAEINDQIKATLYYLNGAFSSGLINSYRKNHISSKYQLLEATLDHLSNQSVDETNTDLIQRAFLISRAGELQNNQSLLSSGSVRSIVVSGLLKKIEPLEKKMYSDNLSDKKWKECFLVRNNLRSQYLKILNTSFNKKKVPLFRSSPAESRMVFLEGQDFIFQFFWQGEKKVLTKHPKEILLRKLLDTNDKIQDAESVYAGSKNNFTQLKSNLEDLYSTFFVNAVKPGNRLVIDADGILNDLPFEALVNKGKYLIDEIDVVYSRIDMGRLEIIETDPKVFSLHGNYKNEKLFLSGAQRERFQATLKKTDKTESSIWHIATHQVLNNQNDPVLLLSDLDSIRRLDFFDFHKAGGLPTQMILTSCESLVGYPVNGELSKSFGVRAIEVGVQSLIGSLWSIDDLSAMKIINEYFKKVKDGNRSSSALNNAKRDFLAVGDSFNKHPFFWSALVHYGHDIRLKTHQPYLMVNIGIGLILLALGCFSKYEITLTS